MHPSFQYMILLIIELREGMQGVQQMTAKEC